MKIEKHHEGTTIWGVPTGNNTRRHKKPESFSVQKVNRRFAVMTFHGREDSYDRSTGVTQSSANGGYHNAGWLWFESPEDVAAHRLRIDRIHQIKRELNSFSWERGLSDADITRLHEMLCNRP